MTTYTANEQRIFNLIADESLSGGVLGVSEIASMDEMTAAQIKGVVSSLIQKGRVAAVDDCLWPIHSEHGPCFWCDYVSEGEEEFITDDQVA